MSTEKQLDFKKIVKQLEYYFSDFNMVKDTFMKVYIVYLIKIYS